MDLSAAEIARYLRMGRERPAETLAEKIRIVRDDVLKDVVPRSVFRRFTIPDSFRQSKSLSRHLSRCREVYYLVATLGAAFDAHLRRASVAGASDAFIAQAVGAAAIEKYLDACEEEIRAELAPGESLTSRFSPGYGDFPLDAHRELIGAVDASRRLGVMLTETLLLVPSKSVTAVVGVFPPGETK